MPLYVTEQTYLNWIRKAAEIVGLWEVTGKEYSHKDVWKEVTLETNEGKEVPEEFEKVFEDDRFKRLVEFRKRKSIIKSIEHVAVIREMLSETAFLANLSILEDLIMDPSKIDFTQRRLLAKDLTSALVGKKGRYIEEPEEETQDNVLSMALVEDSALQELLAKYPEKMHESIIKRWKLERLRYISNQEHEVRSQIK